MQYINWIHIFEIIHLHIDSCQCFLWNISPSVPYACTQEHQILPARCYLCLLSMEYQSKPVFQEHPYLFLAILEILCVPTYNLEIINISAIMLCLQLPFHILVKNIQIYIAIQLAHDVTNRQTHAFW